MKRWAWIRGEASCVVLARSAGVCVLLGMVAQIADAQSADNPLGDATIVWHLSSRQANENYPLDLRINGTVQVGQELDAADRAQSLKRGGDGLAAVFDGGYLSLDVHRAMSLRAKDDALSLYIRARGNPGIEGTLFFSDMLTFAVHPTGLAISFLGVKTPSGRVFREVPLGLIKRDGWLDFVIRIGDRKLDFFQNGELRNSTPINQALCAPFDDVLQIGAFAWSGPDLYEYTPVGIRNCTIDAVALWGRALSDNEVAFLSGVESLQAPTARNRMDRAIQDYNEFFDASVNKDVAACGRLWKSLRELADQDPVRPTFHLTQPFGCIFDPVGAYYFEGRYHVFSYHNITNLLRYSSLDHYVSDDLVHWTAWPIGPWADCPLDVYGIWLMNHFVDDQGVPNVIYTALGNEGKHGVWARSTDGLVSYGDKKAVLTKYHHDGHVWKEGDTWYTITSKMSKGTRPGGRGDGVMLWSSLDLEHWREIGEIFASPQGFMEFPYLLPFGDKDVLILGGHPVRYWVGHFDRAQVRFIPDYPDGRLLDYANRFHCDNPSIVDQKGPGGTSRRIIVALYADLGGGSEELLPWNSVQAMPRSLELHGDHLCQEPVPEMQSLRGACYSKQDLVVTPGQSGYVDKRGDTVEIIADFEPRDARCFGLKVRVSQDGQSGVRVFFDAATNECGVDGATVAQARGPSYLSKGQLVRMHVFLDKLLLETFINGQTCTVAAKHEPHPACDGIDLFSEGGAARCTKLEIWDLKPATR